MSYSSEVLADTPGRYYKLDDTSGTACVDSSASATNLTYVNSPTLSVSPLITVGTAVTFNGTSQDARGTSSTGLTPATAITIEAWVKTTANPAAQEVLCSDDSSGSRYFQFRLITGGKVEVTLFDTGHTAHIFAGTIAVNDGNRHQIAATYDVSNVIIYVDGAQDNSTAASFTLATSQSNLCLGARRSGGSDSTFFNGTIDEVSFYRSALSAARILAHYTAGLAGTEIKTIMGVSYSTNVKTMVSLAQATIKKILGLT